MMMETTQCSKRPAAGDLNGLLEAQILEKGRIPSRPSSWMTAHGVSIDREPKYVREKRTSTLRENHREDVSEG
jgi:hypothetical protein